MNQQSLEISDSLPCQFRRAMGTSLTSVVLNSTLTAGTERRGLPLASYIMEQPMIFKAGQGFTPPFMAPGNRGNGLFQPRTDMLLPRADLSEPTVNPLNPYWSRPGLHHLAHDVSPRGTGYDGYDRSLHRPVPVARQGNIGLGA